MTLGFRVCSGDAFRVYIFGLLGLSNVCHTLDEILKGGAAEPMALNLSDLLPPQVDDGAGFADPHSVHFKKCLSFLLSSSSSFLLFRLRLLPLPSY